VITPSDIGILSLLSTLATLSSQITSLTSQITLERFKMLQANSAKQLSLVKSHLIRRKQLESVLEKRINSKDRIGEVLYAIEKAVGDEEIMKALELGTSTLRLLISSPTLSLDHIEETTTALEDALADSKEINEAINEGVLDKGAEEAVEAELKELIRAEREEEEEKLAKQSEEKEKEKEIEKLMEKLNIDQAPITTLPSSTTSVVERSGVAQVDEAVENLRKVLVTDH
jgi:charged multivesicular body protein 7